MGNVGGVGTAGIQWIEVRDTTKHLLMAAIYNKELPGQNAHSAEAEKSDLK